MWRHIGSLVTATLHGLVKDTSWWIYTMVDTQLRSKGLFCNIVHVRITQVSLITSIVICKYNYISVPKPVCRFSLSFIEVDTFTNSYNNTPYGLLPICLSNYYINSMRFKLISVRKINTMVSICLRFSMRLNPAHVYLLDPTPGYQAIVGR